MPDDQPTSVLICTACYRCDQYSSTKRWTRDVVIDALDRLRAELAKSTVEFDPGFDLDLVSECMDELVWKLHSALNHPLKKRVKRSE